MGLIQTDAIRCPLEEVRIARMVFTAAEAVAADTDGLMAARAATAPCHATLVAASAETDTLTINFVATQAATPVGKVSFVLDANASDALAVSGVDATGVITIKLANGSANKNTAALIQAAIRGLTPTGDGAVEGIINGISIAAVVCVAAGNWDSAAIAESTETDMTDVQCTGGDGETITPDETVLFHQPPCCRTITATAAGTQNDTGAVSVILYGTNINDEPISETLAAWTVNVSATKTSTKAFKTITSVFLPSHDGTGATVSLGYSDALGVPFMFSKKPYLRATLNGVIENAPTQVTDADEIEKNTVDLASALNGTEVCLYYILPEA